MDILQLIFGIVFFVVITVFLIFKRREIVWEWLVYPVIYFAMYRSSWGIKAMDSIANRWRPALRIAGIIAVGVGFVGMGLISYQLVKNVVTIVTSDSGAATVGIVQPFAQNVPGTIFVPFVYFIISIFVIAVLHEFSHGVMARVHGCKVRSSGFAFLGILVPIIPAAFVEPDEVEMSRRSASSQLSILASGAVSNIIFSLVLLGVILYIAEPLSEKVIHHLGVEVVTLSKGGPAELAGLHTGELVTSIEGIPLKNSRQMLEILNAKKAGDLLSVQTDKGVHPILLAENTKHPGKPLFGVQVMNKFEISKEAQARFGTILPEVIVWLVGLLFWLFNLSLGIGLFNLVPLGPIDGGKMFQIGLSTWFEKHTAHTVWKAVSILFFSAILFNVGAAFFV